MRMQHTVILSALCKWKRPKMLFFVVKRYAVREAKKWRYAVRKAKIGRYAVRKAKIGRYAVRKGGSPSIVAQSRGIIPTYCWIF